MFAFTRLKCLWNVFSWIEKYFGSNGNELNTNCMFLIDWVDVVMTRHWAAHATFSLAAKGFSSALLHPQDVLEGICHRASCKAGGVEGWQRIAGWVIWRRRALSLLCGFIGHRCSVSAPVDASSSKHHFSSTSALTPSIANILIETPSTISPVFSCKTNFQHFKPQTNKSTNLLCELTPLLTGIANPTLKAWNKVP